MPVKLSPQFYVRKMRVILTSAPAIAYGTRFDAVCMIIIYHTPFYHTFGTKCSTSSTTPRPRMYYPRYVLHVVHVKVAVEPRRQSKAWSCIVGTNDKWTCVTTVQYVPCLRCGGLMPASCSAHVRNDQEIWLRRRTKRLHILFVND